MNENIFSSINAVDGFDPSTYAVDYTDLGTGETRTRLPVAIQIAWFRLKYPEGRVSVTVEPGHGCFIAKARIYRHYNDPADNYLAEATASRGGIATNPGVSPREWAQTAAIGIALRNAGFSLFGESSGSLDDDVQIPNVEPLPVAELPNINIAPPQTDTDSEPSGESRIEASEYEPEELDFESACKLPCPITKHAGKTLGEVLVAEPKALIWIAEKFSGDPKISAAAQLICQCALAAV